jgi:hypothetical protein
MRWAALLSAGGTLFSAGSCLPENYFATLWGDTVVTGVTNAVLQAVLTNVGL